LSPHVAKPIAASEAIAANAAVVANFMFLVACPPFSQSGTVARLRRKDARCRLLSTGAATIFR
jgi:hypothetical protein